MTKQTETKQMTKSLKKHELVYDFWNS